MVPFFLLSLLCLTALAIGGDFFEDDTDADADAPPPEPETPTPDGPTLPPADDDGDATPAPNPAPEDEDEDEDDTARFFLGSSGDDTINAESEGLYPFATIMGGRGDDVIDLQDGPDGGLISGKDIYGGDGDDQINVRAENSTITGDDGNDTINVDDAGDSSVFGGDGNDTLTGTLIAQNAAYFDGGAGDDTLDARNMENANLQGGEGNDTILISGANQPGAGYVVEAYGGTGDDMIVFDGAAVTGDEFAAQTAYGGAGDEFAAQTAYGGAGDDTYSLRFNEGGVITGPTGDPVEVDVITLGDFERGSDTLEVAPYAADTAFDIASARLEEDAGAGLTRLIVTYEHPAEVDRDVVVTINATNMTWDDVDFAPGAEPAVLVPLA